MRSQFIAPARVSQSKMGRPVSIGDTVPGKVRLNYKHRLFWSARHSRHAEQYNSIAEMHDKPCFRRWLELIGSRVPKLLSYKTIYSPPCIDSNPTRTWTVVRDNEEYITFTNCIEAWLICLSGNEMTRFNWSVIYRDRKLG